MAIIVPAILENTKEEFLDKVSRVVKLPGLERVQVDFGDGIFIPNKILPVAEMDTLNPAFHWEAHLMLKEPKEFLDYQICGFKTLLVHYEAFESLDNLQTALESIRSLGMKCGVVINPTTKVEVLKEFVGLADQFLIMSVNPGFQGQAFLEETFSRVKELRMLLPNAIIEVDGGVSLSNIRELSHAGADLLVVGSALLKAPNILEAYQQLQKEIES